MISPIGVKNQILLYQLEKYHREGKKHHLAKYFPDETRVDDFVEDPESRTRTIFG